MDKGAAKTILIVIASGIGGILLFICVLIGAAYYYLGPGKNSESVIQFPPEIIEKGQAGRFLGSHATYTGDASCRQNKTLASGPGLIVGSVISSGKPVEGLKLRLCLNGSVMSQPAITDADGKYSISVPYGKYKVDGYTLDSSTLDHVLGGKTDHPGNAIQTGIFEVGENDPGAGLFLTYVDPVKLIGPKGTVGLSDAGEISWEPYPEATSYGIQVYEWDDQDHASGFKELFEWRDRPTVFETSVDILKHGAELREGRKYSVEIYAYDEKGRIISNTGNKFREWDFLVDRE